MTKKQVIRNGLIYNRLRQVIGFQLDDNWLASGRLRAMLAAPACYKRKCKHYIGVLQPDGTEMTERPVCAAYPTGIPNDIAYGTDKHKTIRPDQTNTIIYEKLRP